MAEAHLRGRISLDGKQAEKAIDGIVNRIGRFERTVKGAAKALGILFAVNMIQRGTSAIFDHINEIRELERQYSLTAVQAQKLQKLSLELGVPVGELAGKWKEAGVNIGKTLDKFKELNKDNFLTDQEVELAKEFDRKIERAKTEMKSDAASFLSVPAAVKAIMTGPNPVTRAVMMEMARQGGFPIPPVEPVMEETPFPKDWDAFATVLTKSFHKIPGAPLNALQQVGAFSNPNAGPITIMREQLSELKEIKSNTSKLGKESIHE